MGCANSVKTDESFYEFNLVDNDYLNSLNFDERKNMNVLVTILNGEKDITIDLDNLKSFMKVHVFMLLFHFFTEGLPKYDIDDADLPNQYDDDAENLPRITTKIYINNSIVCLDDLRDSIACRLDLCLFYERLNIKSIKEKLMNKAFNVENESENSMICYELRFNIIKCNPFFCKYADLDGAKSLKKISKRELVKPFALCYTSRNKVERFEVDRFRINTGTDIIVEKVAVKISINQIASFISMIRNTSKILTERYSNKIKNDERIQLERRSPKDSLEMKPISDRNDTSTDGTTIVEEATNFRETIDIFSTRYNMVPTKRIPKSLEVEDEIDEKDALCSKAKNLLKLQSPTKQIKSDIDAIEEEEMKVMEEETNTKDTFTFFFQGLNIFFINDYRDNYYPVLSFDFEDTHYARENRIDGSFVSQSQLQAKFSYYNLYNGYWEPFVEGLNISFEFDKTAENKVIQIKGTDSINLNVSPQFISVLNYCMKSCEQAHKSIGLVKPQEEIKSPFGDQPSEEDKEMFEKDIQQAERQTMLNFDEDQDIVDVATPYKVVNLTGMNIFIETLFEQSKGTDNKYILSNGETTKIAISYDKQASRNAENSGNKINDNVKIQFQGLYLPIEKIPLNKLGSKLHKLSENDDEYDFIFYENKVVDMNKVLTLRTQNLLINSTQFTYLIMIRDPDEDNREKRYKLLPNDCIAFPREFHNTKIAMKTIDDEQFSNYISAKKLVFNSKIDHTNYIKSGNTFTMIRKENSKTIKDCHDIHLIPPIRIRNGLPVTMQVQLVGQDYEFILDKSEEQHISFYSPDKVIQL